MKRTLSGMEIQILKDRLDRLMISYVEIYDELLDHYITALEQFPAEEFQTKRESLDDEFTWSVVRGMEKQLVKTAWREIGIASKSSYKVWKLGAKKMGILVLSFILMGITFQLLGPEYFYALAIGSFGCLMIVIIYLNRKNLHLTFSLAVEKHRPKKVLPSLLLSLFVVAFNLVNLLAMSLPKILDNTSYEYFTPYIFLSLGILILAFSWMIYTACDLKNFKIIRQ
jgi:hypothetical protein